MLLKKIKKLEKEYFNQEMRIFQQWLSTLTNEELLQIRDETKAEIRGEKQQGELSRLFEEYKKKVWRS